jgi:hypothetical protein
LEAEVVTCRCALEVPQKRDFGLIASLVDPSSRVTHSSYASRFIHFRKRPSGAPSSER